MKDAAAVTVCNCACVSSGEYCAALVSVAAD